MELINKKHILIIRSDKLGDNVLFTGALKYFKGAYRNSVIDLAINSEIKALYKNCPYIDNIIDFKALSYVTNYKYALLNKVIKKGRKLFFEFYYKFLRKYDIIISPVRSVNPEVLWVIERIKAKEKIGIVGCPNNCPKELQYKKKQIFTKYLTIHENEKWQSEIKTNFDFLNVCGIKLNSYDQIWPEFWIKGEESIRPLLNINSKSGQKLVVLAPFASTKYRETHIFKYLHILQNDDHVVLVGDKERLIDSFLIRDEIEKNGNEVTNLVGSTSINELIALVQKASYVISVESAILHIAIACRIKTFAIVGGGHWGRFFPWGPMDNVIWINKMMECFQCNWECRYDDFRCIDNIIPL